MYWRKRRTIKGKPADVLSEVSKIDRESSLSHIEHLTELVPTAYRFDWFCAIQEIVLSGENLNERCYIAEQFYGDICLKENQK